MSLAQNQLRIVRGLWARLLPLDRQTTARLRALLADRRFGGRDRRLYRELLLTAMRLARALAKLPPDDEASWAALVARAAAATRDTEAFRAAFASTPAPTPSLPEPITLLPDWFTDECDPAAAASNSVALAPGVPSDLAAVAAALLARAPVWVRLQSATPSAPSAPASREAVLAEWRARGWSFAPHPVLPDAFRLPPETPITSAEAYLAGHYEVQDIGSQRILADLDLPARSPGPRWLDACAGAGGKTLQLAALLGPAARVDATDIRPAALDELRARAARAGLAARIRTLPASALPPAAAGGGDYDGVLVDAPCSGSGTWRRAPHLMACTTRADLAAAAELQRRLLAEAAARVRPGGWLVYATCSIAHTENSAVAADFLARHGDTFAPLDPAAPAGRALLPGREDNDGFFVAAFRRQAA